MKIIVFITSVCLVALFFASCAGHQKQNNFTKKKPISVEPIHVEAKRNGEKINLDAYNANELFDRAAKYLRKGQCNKAIEIYQKLVLEFKSSNLASPSLYNIGLCADSIGDIKKAASAYNQLVNEYPKSDDVTDALFQLGGAYEKLEAWGDSITTFDKLLFERKDLKDIERMEALARKGSSLINIDKEDEAWLILKEAVRLYKHGNNISPVDSVYHYSMAQFKLAEIVHNKMRSIELPVDDKNLATIMDDKAGLLLDSQRLYTKVIRIGHPHWAAAAAYRIGSLYHHLWVDLIAAPAPKNLNEEERQVYSEVLKQKIKVLLKKSVVQWERTLKLAIRLNLDNEWIESTQKDLKKIKHALAISKTEEMP